MANVRHSQPGVSKEAALIGTSGVSLPSAYTIRKVHKFHWYQMKICQELTEYDSDRILHFREQKLGRTNNNNEHVENVCFRDECTFYLNGFVYKHHCDIVKGTYPVS